MRNIRSATLGAISTYLFIFPEIIGFAAICAALSLFFYVVFEVLLFVFESSVVRTMPLSVSFQFMSFNKSLVAFDFLFLD